MLFAVSLVLWLRVPLAERSAIALLSTLEEIVRSRGLERDSGFAVEDLWGGEEVEDKF